MILAVIVVAIGMTVTGCAGSSESCDSDEPEFEAIGTVRYIDTDGVWVVVDDNRVQYYVIDLPPWMCKKDLRYRFWFRPQRPRYGINPGWGRHVRFVRHRRIR